MRKKDRETRAEELRAKKEEFDEKLDRVVEVSKKTNEKVEKTARGFWSEFKKFVAKGNIVDLAVAVVVGTAFNNIVNALVKNIITPLTSIILPSGDIKSLKWVLTPAVEADEELGIEAVEEVAVTYGVFIESVIDFLIIALSIFIVMKTFLKLKDALHKKERLAAEEKARELAAKKKAEAEAEEARLAQIKKDFIDDVAAQADTLNDIKEIMLRMENKFNNS